MIIVVPSCLKDADGARTRSDQKPNQNPPQCHKNNKIPLKKEIYSKLFIKSPSHPFPTKSSFLSWTSFGTTSASLQANAYRPKSTNFRPKSTASRPKSTASSGSRPAYFKPLKGLTRTEFQSEFVQIMENFNPWRCNLFKPPCLFLVI